MRWRVLGCVLLLGGVGLAADRVSITLTAKETPAKTVLAQVARSAKLELDVAPAVPDPPVSLEFRDVSVDAAMQQLCDRLRCTWQVADGRLKVTPIAAPAVILPPRPDGLPQSLFDEERTKLTAVQTQPEQPGPVDELGRWLRAQRPDWRAKLSDLLSDLWLATDSSSPGALRGARAMAALGEGDAARRLLPVARREQASEPAARCLSARLELDRGNAARALAELSLASRLQPDSPEVAALTAEAALLVGRDKDALAGAFTAHARWPHDERVLASLGNILRRDEVAAGQAARYLQQALDVAPRLSDALFGLAVLAGRDDPGDAEPWRAFLREEPYSVRADRIRLALVAVAEVEVAEYRGAAAMDVTRDGERALYYHKFRKQLEIADTRGTRLANQVTDQDSDKVFGSISPDEQWLAWIVPGGDADRVFLQGVNASGKHAEVAAATRGSRLRRTTWSPDSRYLLFTEVRDGGDGRQVKLRCWDRQDGKEVPPPAPLDAPGLGDVAWTDAGIVAVRTAGSREAVVLVEADGTQLTLRPPARVGTYVLPAVDSGLTRVVAQGSELSAAPADGSVVDGVPVLSGASSTEPGLWINNSNRLLVTLSDQVPTALALAGLTPRYQLLAKLDPTLAQGPKPPRYEFRLRSLTSQPLTGTAKLVAVRDDGTSGWSASLPVTAKPDAATTAAFAPTDAEPGAHWLRLELTFDGNPEPPRWYRYDIVAQP